MKLSSILFIISLSVTISNASRRKNARTCTELKSDTLDIQCQRGFRTIPCDRRMLPGSTGSLACKPGYQLSKEPEFTQVTCGNDGIWDNCLFSCEPECGNPTPVEAEFKSDPPVKYLAGQYPWLAMIFDRSGDIFSYRCPATIINHRMVLSVAVYTYKPEADLNDLRVSVGSSVFRWNRTEDEYFQGYEVEKVVAPKGYSTKVDGRPNEISIIIVKGNFIFNNIIKPICLDRHFNGPIEELPLGTQGYVMGFNSDRQIFDQVRFVYNMSLPFITNSSCRAYEHPFKRFYTTYDKFCVGNLTFDSGIPNGMIGGGYFVPEYKDFNTVYYIRGVAALQAREATFLAVTDINVHLPWILQQEKLYLTDNSTKPPEFCGPASKANASVTLAAAGTCILPAMPSNGRYFVGGLDNTPVGSSVPEWSVLKYQCDSEFAILGGDTSFCSGGTWSNNPICRRLCKPLISVSLDIYCSLNNEEVSCGTPMTTGTTADLSCKKGYSLDYAPDNTKLTCEEDGSWNASPFKCSPECGLPTPKGHTLVVGGATVETGDFPWHAGIYEKNSTNNAFNKQICGGSIINAKMVLSAAHCFYPTGGRAPYDKDRFAVAVGKIYRNWTDPRDKLAQFSDAEQILIHPAYDDIIGNYAQDIAIVVLTNPVSFSSYVRPICIKWTFRGVEEEMRPNTRGIVSGWGLTSEAGEPSEILKSITLPTIPRYMCRDNFPADFRPYLTPGKFCAGYQNGSSLCQGDSGGGLSFPQSIDKKTTIYFLRGVVSVGPTKDGTCDSSQYTVFTSVLANLEWMKNHGAHLSI